MERVGECSVLGYGLSLYGEKRLFKGQEIGEMVGYKLDTNNYKSRDISQLIDLADVENVFKCDGMLYVNGVGLYQILLRSYKADKYREKINTILEGLGINPIPINLSYFEQIPRWRRDEVVGTLKIKG